MLKIFASCFIASNCSSPNFKNGAAGAGFCSACVNSVAAIVAASAEESLGISKLCGKNSTVRTIRVPRVRGMKTS